MVRQIVCLENFIGDSGSPAWAASFLDRYRDSDTLFRQFDARTPQEALGFKSSAYLGDSRARKAMIDSACAISGLSKQDAMGYGLGGTHRDRRMFAIITGQLSWPDDESGVGGDWAQKGVPNARATKGSAPVVTRNYRSNSAPGEMLNIRSRYLKALRAGFEAFGTDQVSWSTTWEDTQDGGGAMLTSDMS